MKKLFVLLTFLAAGISVPGMGEGSTSERLAVVNDAESGKVKVIYKAEGKAKVKFRLLDAESNELYSATLKSSGGFILPLNFSNLERGTYTIELTDASGQIIERIEYARAARPPVQLRARKVENASYAVLLSGADAGKVQIRFFDGKDNLVYDVEENVQGEFGKLFTFREHPVEVSAVEVSGKHGTTRVQVN
jgi:hypothetical protein